MTKKPKLENYDSTLADSELVCGKILSTTLSKPASVGHAPSSCPSGLRMAVALF